MSAEEWMQVKEVFAELASSDTASRNARMQALEEPVRRELEWLLANHDEATGEHDYILNKPVLDSPGLLQWLGDAQVFSPGQVLLDRFEIIRLIGRGGMGEVYEALDKDHPELIAIKTIRLELVSDPRVRERFRTEVQRSRQVSHENVCRVHELFFGTGGDDSHFPFFSMELLRGDTLSERVRRNGPLLPWEARSIAHQICAGLEAAHRCGVVHRDLKSSNVILLRNPDRDDRLHAKITDFGLARELPPPNPDSNVTMTLPDGAGTLAYMAPELLEGKNANTASDIYALGVVLFRMVTARYPFEASDLVSATMRLRHPAPSPRTYVADLSRAWERTILACLAVDPKLRPESADRVAQLLQDVPSALWSHRKRVVARHIERRTFMLSGLAAVGVGATGLWLKKESPPFAGKEITVLVEDFESFDPGGALGRAARNMLRVAFSRSESVKIVRPAAVMEAAKELNVGAVAIRGETALRIARHTKADGVIRGSLQRSDAGFQLRLDAYRSADEAKLLIIEDWAKDQQQLAQAVERAAGNLQVGLTGGSLAAFQTGMPRVEPADTVRPDALELFTAGLEYFQYGDHSTALAHLEQASRIDPNFAMAHVYQAITHSSLGREDLELSPISRAHALRSRVNDRQRMHIDAFYHERCGDLSTSLNEYRALIAMYPNEAHLRVHIAHLCARMDRVAELEQHARTAVELAPRSALSYMILASGLAQAGKVEEAGEVLVRGRKQCGDSPLFLSSEGVVKLVGGDLAGALAKFQSLERAPEYSAHARSHIIHCLLVYGRLVEARARLETDIAVNQIARESIRADVSRYHLASLLNLQGDREHAVELALILASRSPEPYNLFPLRGAAEVAAEARSPAALESALDKVRRVRDRYPSSRLEAIVLHVRALQAGVAGRTEEERRMLAQAFGMCPDLPNTWAFAQVCSHRREFNEALPLYESVIGRRGAAVRFESQMQLLRSYAESARCYRALGNKQKALERYDEFLHLWGSQTNLGLVGKIQAERQDTLSGA